LAKKKTSPKKKKAAKKSKPKKKVAKKPAKKRPVKKAVKKAAKKKPAKAKAARKPNAAFMAKLTPSSTLAAVIGGEPRPRTDMIKKIWDYIRANNLQDQQNKRMINADDKLRALFGGKDQVSMFDLAKIISQHVS
jgi:chromatin remodeling complex protein RSC6